MKFFRRIQDIDHKARQILQERGIKVLLQSLLFKIQSMTKPKPQLSLQAWLTFYQNRGEIRQQPLQDKDVNKLPRVTILILTYNNLLFTKICLHNIYSNTTYPNFEVIAVDNASNDETPSWLSAFALTHPNLRVILNTKNLGFAGGNNQGAREADGEYIIFLNNDTVVTQGWVERLLKHMQRDPRIGLIGPVTNSTGNEARIPINYVLPAEMEMFAENRTRALDGQTFNIRMLAFYCVMTRKDQFETIGGLDERFAVGMFEDDDIAVRYLQKGLKVVCAEDVFIHHFHSASFSNLKKDHYNRIFAENRQKYEEKWGRAWEPYHARQEIFLHIQKLHMNPFLKPWGTLHYRCNICGQACENHLNDLEREKPSCTCGSTVRSRSIIHLLSMELFGRSIALPDFPVRPDLRGWGMSDAGYTGLLSQKIGYINTFYHKEPRFDISAPLDPKIEGTLDFLISTEVFEHIIPPVSPAFENARRLLKPTGRFVFTVPYTLKPDTQEHFPDLYQYEIIEPLGIKPTLRNLTRDGREQIFDNLVFHGGPGSTLEMRVFSQNGLLAEFEKAGFKVTIHPEPCWEFGIYWKNHWSLPVVAWPSHWFDAEPSLV